MLGTKRGKAPVLALQDDRDDVIPNMPQRHDWLSPRTTSHNRVAGKPES